MTRDYYQPGETRPRACSVLLEQRKHRTKDLILRHLSTDRLRLDVTMVRTGELFSWVGASNFDDKGIDRLVRDGPMGTGAYGVFLNLVFREDAKAFMFERTLLSDGRSLMEYSFRVNRPDSHYRVKLDKSWVYTAYSGTFQVDPKTDEVVRMNLQEDDLPDATDYYCTTITSLNFQTAQIGNIKFVLAARAAQRLYTETARRSRTLRPLATAANTSANQDNVLRGPRTGAGRRKNWYAREACVRAGWSAVRACAHDADRKRHRGSGRSLYWKVGRAPSRRKT